MKACLMLGLSSLLSSLEPGCGAAFGTSPANGAGGDAAPPVLAVTDVGATHATSCGALGVHYFCESFDGAELPGAFGGSSTSAGTTTLDTGKYRSAPGSLLATTLHATTTTRTYAWLERSFAESASHFTLAFAEWVDPGCVGGLDGVDTGVLTLHAGTYFVSVRHGNASDAILETSLSGGIFVQAHQLRAPIPRGKWAHLTLDVDVAKSTFALLVDGETVVENEPMKYPLNGGPEVPKISLGTLTDDIAGPSACSVNIDDVTLDVAP